jgi:hypothetical protein
MKYLYRSFWYSVVAVLLAIIVVVTNPPLARATAIDVGAGAADRGSQFSSGFTLIDFNNPANDTGTITSIELWFSAAGDNATGVLAGTFSGSGVSYDDRDYETIGNVAKGSKQTFSGLNCDVVTGDFLGVYAAVGWIEQDTSGYVGIGYVGGDKFGTGAQTYTTTYNDDAISVYGAGATPSAPTVTTQAVSDVEETTATGNGNVTSDGGSAITERGVCWNTTGTPTTADSKATSAGTTGVYTASIITLTKGELYYVRAYAINAIGTSYGAEVTFLTKPDEPTGFTATPGDAHNLLAWTTGAGFQKTMVRFRTDGVYPTDEGNGTQAYFDAANSYNHTLLTNGLLYKYRMWSYATEGGLTRYSDLYASAEATPVAFVAPTVETGVCSGFTANAAVLNGMVTANGDAVPTQWGFDYGLTTSYGSSSTFTSPTSPSLNESFWTNLTGLLPATVYHYRAKAYNGAWGYGDNATFSTKGSPVRYEYLDTGQDAASDNIYGNTWGYQQFTVTDPLTSDNISHTVTSINVYIKRVSAATPTVGTVTLSLKHASGGLPTGNDLVVTTFDGNAISTSYTMYHFDTDAAGQPINVNVEANHQYAIVIAAKTGDASNYIVWGTVGGGALADAIYGASTDGGLSYVLDAGADDALFEIWGNPCIEVLGAKVFTGYKETDDWLVVADVNNIYVPYYPDNDPQLYFQLQIISGATIKSATNFRAWGRQPLAIYLNEATASTLSWGGVYKIRIQSLLDVDVFKEYTLVAGDWNAGDLLYLDGHVRTLASTYETYNSTTYLVSSTGQSNQVLNEAGSIMFMRGIAGLEIVRPALFYTSFSIAKPGVTSHTLFVPNPAAALGADAYGRVNEIANLFTVDAETIIGWVLLGLALLIGIGCVGVGHGMVGLIIGLFFAVGAGFVFGGIPIAIIGAIGFIFLMVIVIWLGKILFSQS